MDSSKLRASVIIVLAAFAALYLGIAAATARMEAVAWVVGALGIVCVLALGKHVWAIIPLTLSLAGTINALPGSPSPWWAAMAIVGTIYIIRTLMRHTAAFQFRFNLLDLAILLQVAAIGQAYLRNPTGLSMFGGDVVGGKPYFIFGFAFIAYAILAMTKTDIRVFRWVVIGMILVSVADGALILLSQLVPTVAMVMLPLYSGVDFSAGQSGATYKADEGRLTTGQGLGKTLGLAAFTLYPPVSCLNPLKMVRFLMIMTALAVILLSGYRSALGWLMIVFVVGSIVRGRFVDLAISAAVGIVALAVLAGSGMAPKLPYGMQRVLSIVPFMPIDDNIRKNAEDSTTWRVEMWKLALTSDRYISNKWLGDGFNYSAAELKAAQEASFGDGRRSIGMNMQDTMLARGSYHGFHVETIRFTGALGLACALFALGVFFKFALKSIRHFKGRPEWGYVLFICVPFLIHPFYYMLVFGAYRSGFSELLVAAGLLKVLDNIRVRELATARDEGMAPESAKTPVLPLSPGRISQPAMRRR